MQNNKYDTYKKIFSEHNGILRRIQAIKLGIPEYMLYEMYKEGELIKEGRGLFRLRDVEPLGNPDLVQASILIPKCVICLTSALYFHKITTQIPFSIFIALPKQIKKPRIEYPPLEVFWLLPEPFSTGIEEHTIDGITVKIYNLEKTIADCFKFRKRIGEDIALEALKEYVSRPKVNIHRLLGYARVDRVERIVTPYLKSLV